MRDRLPRHEVITLMNIEPQKPPSAARLFTRLVSSERQPMILKLPPPRSSLTTLQFRQGGFFLLFINFARD